MTDETTNWRDRGFDNQLSADLRPDSDLVVIDHIAEDAHGHGGRVLIEIPVEKAGWLAGRLFLLTCRAAARKIAAVIEAAKEEK